MTKTNPKVIFFGNGPLADAVEATLLSHGIEIIFHARTKEDLETVKQLKIERPETHGVLASYGVLIKSDLLDLFEPEGILNIHPSLLPDLRGSSPIESAILRGDTKFGVSVMKLVKNMDAGPVFYQTTLNFDENTPKFEIYDNLAIKGAEWLVSHLSEDARASKMPAGHTQNALKATFCGKLATTQSELKPALKSARELHNEVRAYAKFPKSRYEIFGLDCIIRQTHVSVVLEPHTYVFTPDGVNCPAKLKHLALKCQDGNYLYIDSLQPAGKRMMDAKSFLNGYKKIKSLVF